MIEVKYDFENRKKEDLEQVNGLLSVIKAEDVQLENHKGYLATTRNRKGHITNRRYGIQSGTLICKLAECEEDAHQYQMEAAVVSKEDNLDDDAFHKQWCKEHPARCMRTMIIIEYEDVIVYLLLHHEKKDSHRGVEL